MTESNIWRPSFGNSLQILISTKPHFFNEEGFIILNKIFEIAELAIPTVFYFDHCYRNESQLILFLESHNQRNVQFIENYKNHKLDFGLVFGGDGSILWSNKYIKEYEFELPIFTFNLGNVGFLSKFKLDEIDEVLNSIKTLLRNEVLDKPFYFDFHPKLTSIIVDRDGKEISHLSSINEVLVEKIGNYSNWLDVSIDGLHVVTLNADGIILCTQLGSTAYNASANGPFLFPGSDNFILSAIAPFAINFKSIVLNKNSVLSIKISNNNYSSDVKVNADSNDSSVMTKDQELHVTIGRNRVCIIHREESLKKQWIQKIAKLYKWS